MSNAFGSNMFNPEPQYGEVLQQQALLQAAPISGAPTAPSASAPSAPAPSPGGGMAPPTGIMVDPYYQRLTDTWRALAKRPGASTEVKALAKRSAQVQEVQQR